MNNQPTLITNNKTVFSVEIPVRITDVNYGKHLGHMAVVGIFHQARLLFLNQYHIDEMNVEGKGIILLHSSYTFKHQAFFNTRLIVKVSIDAYSKTKFNFLYEATDKETGKIIVTGREESAFFDYNKGKPSKIPNSFLSFCQSVTQFS